MAETRGRSAQARRAEGRAKRRAAADQHGSEDGEAQEATDLLLGAASAAIAGAAVGAAQALARRREEASADDQREPDEPDEPVEPDEPEESHVPSAAANEAPAPAPPPAPRRARKQPISDVEARDLVDRARAHLRELRGAEPESVSSVTKTPDGWRIGLEVVEVHRIPESTDVLATYELEVDSSGDLLTYQRRDRYTRAEADRR